MLHLYIHMVIVPWCSAWASHMHPKTQASKVSSMTGRLRWLSQCVSKHGYYFQYHSFPKSPAFAEQHTENSPELLVSLLLISRESLFFGWLNLGSFFLPSASRSVFWGMVAGMEQDFVHQQYTCSDSIICVSQKTHHSPKLISAHWSNRFTWTISGEGDWRASVHHYMADI